MHGGFWPRIVVFKYYSSYQKKKKVLFLDLNVGTVIKSSIMVLSAERGINNYMPCLAIPNVQNIVENQGVR